MGLSQGTLTLGVSEAQFDPDVPVERDTIINLASLAIIRATKCETVTYKDKCTAHTGDCDLQKIVVCKAPSDFNIQMKSYDSQGNSALHAMLHVQLKWDDKKTPFDCSVLDTASSLVDAVAGQTDLEKASKVTGAVVAVCKGIASLFNPGGK